MFLNCTDVTKSRKVSHFLVGADPTCSKQQNGPET